MRKAKAAGSGSGWACRNSPQSTDSPAPSQPSCSCSPSSSSRRQMDLCRRHGGVPVARAMGQVLTRLTPRLSVWARLTPSRQHQPWSTGTQATLTWCQGSGGSMVCIYIYIYNINITSGTPQDKHQTRWWIREMTANWADTCSGFSVLTRTVNKESEGLI